MINTRNRQSSVFAAVFYLLLSLTGWLIIAPTWLGGSVTYVIVNGNSMEPRFHPGDLLLVRPETRYRVGDAVAYRNEEIGAFVFHRILNTELDHFILKGDHNEWIDSYHPSQAEIVGKLWLHIPKFGKAIEWVRVSLHMALTIGLLGGILVSGMIMKSPVERQEGFRVFKKPRGTSEGGIYLFGFLILVFMALAIISFLRPLTRAADNLTYQQEGDFSYSAIGAPGIYDSDRVHSGEPVFPQLSCFLDVGFTYHLVGAALQDMAGRYQLVARVSDKQSGWQRTILLNQETQFSGMTYTTEARLDLCQVTALVDFVEQETGLHPNFYTLEIINHTAFTGNLAGRKAGDTFDPSLVFNFDKALFYLAANNTQTDPLHASKASLLNSPDLQVNTFSIFGLQPAVRDVRLISLLGLALSIIGLFVSWLVIYHLGQQSQVVLAKLKYDSLLMDIYEGSLETNSTMIDVACMDDLAKLAERQRTMILHMHADYLHYYYVQNNGTTYRHVISVNKNGIIDSAPIGCEIHESLENHVLEETQPVNQEIVEEDARSNEKGFDTRLSKIEIA